MISTEAIVFGASLLIFILLSLVVRKERRRGRRFFAGQLRGWLDTKVDQLNQWLLRSWDHFIKYIVQLNWYYSIHSVLKTILKFIVAFYTYFENIFEKNRKRTKQLRAEKRHLGEMSHLEQVAEHKEDTALTPAQKKRLRKKKLEEKN